MVPRSHSQLKACYSAECIPQLEHELQVALESRDREIDLDLCTASLASADLGVLVSLRDRFRRRARVP